MLMVKNEDNCAARPAMQCHKCNIGLCLSGFKLYHRKYVDVKTNELYVLNLTETCNSMLYAPIIMWQSDKTIVSDFCL